MLDARIIKEIEYWDPKRAIVGFKHLEKKMVAYLSRGNTIFNPDDTKNVLVWIHDTKLKEVLNYDFEPDAVSVVFPITFDFKVGITDTPISSSQLTKSSDMVGINQSLGFRDADANGVYMDDNGIYLKFGKSIVVIGDEGVYIDSEKVILPTRSKGDLLLKDNQMNILPSFAVLPLPKDIVDIDMLLGIFQ